MGTYHEYPDVPHRPYGTSEEFRAAKDRVSKVLLKMALATPSFVRVGTSYASRPPGHHEPQLTTDPRGTFGQ